MLRVTTSTQITSVFHPVYPTCFLALPKPTFGQVAPALCSTKNHAGVLNFDLIFNEPCGVPGGK